LAIEAQFHNVIATDFIYTIYEKVSNQTMSCSKTNTLSYGKVPTYKLISISFVDKICNTLLKCPRAGNRHTHTTWE